MAYLKGLTYCHHMGNGGSSGGEETKGRKEEKQKEEYLVLLGNKICVNFPPDWNVTCP